MPTVQSEVVLWIVASVVCAIRISAWIAELQSCIHRLQRVAYRLWSAPVVRHDVWHCVMTMCARRATIRHCDSIVAVGVIASIAVAVVVVILCLCLYSIDAML